MEKLEKLENEYRKETRKRAWEIIQPICSNDGSPTMVFHTRDFANWVLEKMGIDIQLKMS